MRIAAHVPDLMDRSRLRSTKAEVALVEEELMAAASTAGCDEVLARSVFFRRFPDLAN